MAKDMNNKLRAECEQLIYKVFDALDPSKTNSDFYKEKFSKDRLKSLRRDIGNSYF